MGRSWLAIKFQPTIPDSQGQVSTYVIAFGLLLGVVIVMNSNVLVSGITRQTSPTP